MAAYRVRFAPITCTATPDPSCSEGPLHVQFHYDAQSSSQGGRQRSRTGCRQCRLQRVKCDGVFPVCLRCRQRRLLCQSSPRLSQWQVETRWISCPLGEIVKPRLLQYWLEKASQMIVIDPENNPFSFPILQHLAEAPSLVHIIQSLGAAHREYFPHNSPTVSLEERGLALQALQCELSELRHPEASFLTISLLGLSHWANPDPRDFGQQHLFAARDTLDSILLRHRHALLGQGNDDNVVAIHVGSFLYWDMCCAHLVEAKQQRPLDTALISQAVATLRTKEHPTCGRAIELIYLLGQVGRYCRRAIQLGQQDALKSSALEQQLCAVSVTDNDPSMMLLYDSFQKHGLILLHRSRVASSQGPRTNDNEDKVHGYAVDIARSLLSIPATSTLLNIQCLPLVTAGAELRSSDVELRQGLVFRLKAIYSMNRVPSTLQAIELLHDIWNMRDSGHCEWWMEYMLISKRWCLLLG